MTLNGEKKGRTKVNTTATRMLKDLHPACGDMLVTFVIAEVD